ncbi:MAG: hypothetical protein LBL83_09815 [Clostridiales bacterium]|nr:hypothetical protein [Clostridiales bacterium]
MICPQCGAELAPDTRFCGICGGKIDIAAADGAASAGAPASGAAPTQAPSSVPTPAPSPASGAAPIYAQAPTPASTGGKAKFEVARLKKFAIPVVAVIVAVAAAVVLWSFFGPSKYEQNKFVYSVDWDDDAIVIRQPGGKIITTIYGYVQNSRTSLNGTKTALLVSEEENPSSSQDGDGYELYLLSDRPEKVSDGVFSMQIAPFGGGVVFTRDVDKGVGALCLYSGGKTATLSTEFDTNGSFTLSPNGTAAGYTIIDGDETIGYVYDGKQQLELGEDMIPIAVADGAKYVYYNKISYDSDGNRTGSSLYVQKGVDAGARTLLGSGAEISYMNRDLSQAVYTKPSGSDNSRKLYLSRDADKGSDLAGNANGFLVPRGTVNGYIYGEYSYWIIGTASFADTYYNDRTVEGNRNIRHITKKFEVSGNVASAVDSAWLADDGKTITFLKRNRVSKIDGSKENAEAVELTEGKVLAFAPLDNGSAIYFVNDDYELFYQKGAGKPVAVGDELPDATQYFKSNSTAKYDSFYSLYSGLYKGNTLFYKSDGELCVSNGGKGSPVRGVDGEVDSIIASRFYIYVETADGADEFVYRSWDGKTFEDYSTH